MATSLGEIFKYIKSMRDCDKPVSYEEIAIFLRKKGYKRSDIEHAIAHEERKERREIYELTKEGTTWNRFNLLLSSITLFIIGVFLLYLSIRYSTELINGNILTKYGYGYVPRNVTIGSIISFFILWVLAGTAIPTSIGLFLKYKKLKKNYFKRKKQGLI